MEALRSIPPNAQIARGLVSEIDLAPFLEERARGLPVFLLLCWDLTAAPTVIHLAKLHLVKHLQQALGLPVIVQIMDDLAFLLDKTLTVRTARALAADNLKMVLAELDPARTFAFLNSEHIHDFYMNVLKLGKTIRLSTVGADAVPNIGVSATNYALRAACAMSFEGVIDRPGRALVVCTDKEIPTYEIVRTAFAQLAGHDAAVPPPPALIAVEEPCSLQSRTVRIADAPADTNIVLTDPNNKVTKSINKYCFSGGKDTLAEQTAVGANLAVDVGAHYLRFFYPLAAERPLDDILRNYGSGDASVTAHMGTGDFKRLVIEHVWAAIAAHQAAVAALAPAAVAEATRIRPLVGPAAARQ